MGPRDINRPILLVGYFGHGNAGDEWIQRQVSAAMPAPSRLAPGPRRPLETFWALRDSAAVVLGGGELFQKRTSLRSLLYYVGIVFLARLLRRPVFAYGISLDPGLPAWARGLVARSLRGAAVWARDAAAAAALGADQAPDSVWCRAVPRAPAPVSLRKILWILRFPGPIEDLAARLDALVARTGWRFGFLPFHPAEDLPGIARLRAGLAGAHRLETWQDPDEIFGRLAAYDLVVSARFHGLMAAALAGRAAAAFPGYAKTELLAEELRMPALTPGGDWEAVLRAAFQRGPADPASHAAGARAGLAACAQALSSAFGASRGGAADARGLSSKNVK